MYKSRSYLAPIQLESLYPGFYLGVLDRRETIHELTTISADHPLSVSHISVNIPQGSCRFASMNDSFEFIFEAKIHRWTECVEMKLKVGQEDRKTRMMITAMTFTLQIVAKKEK